MGSKSPFTQAIFAAIFLHLILRLNRLTYECIRPSVQSYINQYFCDSTTQSYCQNEKNHHKNRPCKRVLRPTTGATSLEFGLKIIILDLKCSGFDFRVSIKSDLVVLEVGSL